MNTRMWRAGATLRNLVAGILMLTMLAACDGGGTPPPIDKIPDPIIFATAPDLLPGTLATSGKITVSGLGAAVEASISEGGEISVNGGAWTSEPVTVNNNDVIRVRGVTGDTPEGITEFTLTVGEGSATFAIPTAAAGTVADTRPDAFDLPDPDPAGVEPGSTVTSEPVIITGINTGTQASVSDGAVLIIDGVPVEGADPVTVFPGQSVQVSLPAPETSNGVTEAVLTIGDVSEIITVVTPPGEGELDAVPDPFTGDIPVDGDPAEAEPGQVIVFGPLTVTGIAADVPVVIVNGEFSIDGGATWTSATDITVTDSASLLVRVRAPELSEARVEARLTVGGMSTLFAVTTKIIPPGSDTEPDAFSFTAQTGVAPGSAVISDPVTIVGIDAPAAITIENGEYRINGGQFTATDGVITAGQALELRVIASETPETDATATVTVGGTSASFTVTTAGVEVEDQPPVANAGIGIHVSGGAEVTLNGTDSSDFETSFEELEFNWVQISPEEPRVDLDDANISQPSFTTPSDISAQVFFVFELTVTDNAGQQSEPASVTVTVDPPAEGNLPPEARISGPLIAVNANDVVTLNGNGSTDPDPDDSIESHEWELLETTNPDHEGLDFETLDQGRQLHFNAPSAPLGGNITFRLTVTDTHGDFDNADFTVHVNGTNIAPSASINGPSEVDERSDVALDANGTEDDGEIVEYAWEQVNATDETRVSLTVSPDGRVAGFTAPSVLDDNTVLEFRLTVTDNHGATDVAEHEILVRDTNHAPVAQFVIEGEVGESGFVEVAEQLTVALDGSTTADDDGDTLQYTWSAADERIEITPNADDPSHASFVAPDLEADEDFVVTLTVSDGVFEHSADATVRILANRPPQNVSAGTDRSVNAGEAVTLEGSGSDPENGPLTIAWTQVAAEGVPNVTLTGANTFTPSFTAPSDVTDPTPLTFQLSVNDNHDQEVTRTVVITVVPQNNQSPTAVITGLSNVDEGATITLSGSDSTDPEEQPLTYQWAQVPGEIQAQLPADTTASTISFPAPNVTQNETLRFSLTVSDGILQHTAFSDVIVRVLDQTPEPFGFDPVIRVPDGGVERTNEIIVTGFEGSLPVNMTVTGAVGVAALEIAGVNRASGAPVNSGETLVVRVGSKTGPTSTGTVEVEIGGVTASIPVTYTSFPIADAGSDRVVLAGTIVTLDGSASNDSDGTIALYDWSQTGGIPVVELTATDSIATFTAPSVEDDVTLTFTLTVTDDVGAIGDDIVEIHIRTASTPTAIITGGPETIDEGDSFTLSAADSTDPEEQSLTYRWIQTDGTAAEFPSGTTSESLEVVAPQVAENQSLTFSLVVTNEDGINSEPASKTVTVVHVPDTQPDVESFQFDPVFASTDADFIHTDELTPTGFDTPVAVNVSSESNPGSTYPVIDGTARPNGDAIAPGQTLAVRVFTRPAGSTDTVQVEIGGVTTSFPVTHTDIPIARAGDDRDVLSGIPAVSLDGSQSSDDDGIASYTWTQTDGIQVTLTGADAATASFDAPVVTEDEILTFKLVVTDNVGAASEDFVNIRVRPPNNPPNADAGDDQTEANSVSEGDLVELDAGGSSDPDGDELTYSWVQMGGPPVQLSGSKTVAPTFTAPPALGGNYFMVFQVTVNDSKFEGTDSDAVVISVQNTVADFTLDFPLTKALTDAPLASAPIITYRGHASAANGSDVLSVTVNGNPATTYDVDSGSWTYDHLIEVTGEQPMQIVVTETSDETMQIDATLEHVEDRRTHRFLTSESIYDRFDLSADGGMLYLTSTLGRVYEFDIRNGSMRAIVQSPQNTVGLGLALSVDPLGDRILLAGMRVEGVFDDAGLGDFAIDDGVTTIISNDSDANANGIDFAPIRDMVVDYQANVAYVTDYLAASFGNRLVAIDLATGIRSVLAEDFPGNRMMLDVTNDRLVIGGCEISAFRLDTGEVTEIFPEAADFCVSSIFIVEGDTVAFGVNTKGGVGGTPAISEFDFETGNHVARSDFSNRNLGPAASRVSGYQDILYDVSRDVLYVLEYTGFSADPKGVIMVDRQTGQRVMIFQRPGI